MTPMFSGQLRHRALSLHGFQSNVRLERRVVVPAFRHVLISSCLETSRLQIVASGTVRFSRRNSPFLGREGAFRDNRSSVKQQARATHA